MRLFAAFCLLLAVFVVTPAMAEDGYDLWLRYRQVEAPALARYRSQASAIVVSGDTPTLRAAREELLRGLGGLLGQPVPVDRSVTRDGAIVLVVNNSPFLGGLRPEHRPLGREGYLIRSMRLNGHSITLIFAEHDIGALYGSFHLLRLIQTRRPLANLDITEVPRVEFRMLNHWDDLDRHAMRGYAGQSLWDWHKLPGWRDPRYTDYARANASIGINGTVVTNVNASADALRPDFLEKVRAVADIMRPYGIRVYLSARFNAPMVLGGLGTADPLDPAVRRWWREKAAEIYRVIPDFGGFLVKANSEGQPGPQDYRRTHADGANMLAEAVGPHGGIVIWRAFVYQPGTQDRAEQAYDEFMPLDGRFAENVIVQVKNGPIDFQPREPFSPLFGAMRHTAVGMEFQVTKEYLGFATHLAYLGTMWEEVLRADTRQRGPNTTVARVLDGAATGQRRTLVAGVANTGTDRNWTGSQFDQANWYALGRMAWNPEASARDIAEDWTRMTWGNDPRLVGPVVRMMMGSHQAVVDYMTPLGLVHLMASGLHYGPGPWVDDLGRPDWNPVYFHRADRNGIGFDRTASGSNAIAQYAPEVARRFGSLQTVGDNYLLFFHHVRWDYRLASGRTIWEELVTRYSGGVSEVRAMRQQWAAMAPYVDADRHAEVTAFLAIQEEEAQWWRDACVAYFQSISGLPLPVGEAPPPHNLAYYRAIRHPYAPGRDGPPAPR